MYSIEEFDKAKSKVMKYILYQRRTEQEVRVKFITTMDINILEDIIDYLKEAKYIDDMEYMEKKVDEYIKLKNLSRKEIEYKFLSKGINKYDIEKYLEENVEKLNNYEEDSINTIIRKKQSTMELNNIKQYLYKRGFNHSSINHAIKNIDM